MQKRATQKESAKKPVDGVTNEYLRMFAAFGAESDGVLAKSRIKQILEESGILSDDPRVGELMAELNQPNDEKHSRDDRVTK